MTEPDYRNIFGRFVVTPAIGGNRNGDEMVTWDEMERKDWAGGREAETVGL